MALKLMRRGIILTVAFLSVLGIVVAQTVWTSSIGYTIMPGASMLWLQTLNLGNIDEGASGSTTLSNVVTIYMTKSQSYTIVIAITNLEQLTAHFSALTLTFKEGTSVATVIDLTKVSGQFTASGPQTLKLNVAVAWTVQPSITANQQSITGQINLTASFA